MSNRFRKYCLGLSTHGGDQRPLSRGRRRLMLAEEGPACGKSHLRVRVCVPVHVPSWICSSGGSGAGWRCQWGWWPPATPSAVSGSPWPPAGSGVPEGCSNLCCAAIL